MSVVSEESDGEMREDEYEIVEMSGSTDAFDQPIGLAPGSPEMRERTENFYIGDGEISRGTQTQADVVSETQGDFHQVLQEWRERVNAHPTAQVFGVQPQPEKSTDQVSYLNSLDDDTDLLESPPSAPITMDTLPEPSPASSAVTVPKAVLATALLDDEAHMSIRMAAREVTLEMQAPLPAPAVDEPTTSIPDARPAEVSEPTQLVVGSSDIGIPLALPEKSTDQVSYFNSLDDDTDLLESPPSAPITMDTLPEPSPASSAVTVPKAVLATALLDDEAHMSIRMAAREVTLEMQAPLPAPAVDEPTTSIPDARPAEVSEPTQLVVGSSDIGIPLALPRSPLAWLAELRTDALGQDLDPQPSRPGPSRGSLGVQLPPSAPITTDTLPEPSPASSAVPVPRGTPANAIIGPYRGCQILARLIQYIANEKTLNISWRNVLNAHTTNRPASLGGGIVVSLAHHMTMQKLHGQHVCRMQLPNSFTRQDAWTLAVESSVCGTQKEAVSEVCCFAFAILMLRDPSHVRIIDNHWPDPSAIVATAAHLQAQLPRLEPGPCSTDVVDNVSTMASASSSSAATQRPPVKNPQETPPRKAPPVKAPPPPPPTGHKSSPVKRPPPPPPPAKTLP